MGCIYLPCNASKARRREAEDARRNRVEIVRELSWGRISRRDLLKWGLFTSAGMLAPIGGLNPFVATVAAQVPTGAPRSPLFGRAPFSQPMPRFDVLPRNPASCLDPAPTEANVALQQVDPNLGGGLGPIEGRPPGPIWAHQRFDEFAPTIAIEVTQARAVPNYTYQPGVPSSLNSGINQAIGLPARFEPNWPTRREAAEPRPEHRVHRSVGNRDRRQ
jgi:hypothetical protein